MLNIFLLALPIYILLSIGFLAVRLRYIDGAEVKGFGSIILKIFLPAMMFLAITGNPLNETLRWDYIFAYAVGSLAIYALGFTIVRLSGRSFGDAAIEAMGMSCSNSAFFALPVATLVVGPEVALQCFALAVLVENLLMIPMAVSLCEVGQGKAPVSVRGVATSILRNPLTVAAIVALVWTGFHLPVPEPADQVLRMMAPVAAPVALLIIGGSVAQLSLRELDGGVARIVIGKLLGHPLAVALVFMLVPSVPDPMRVAGVLGAGVPMISIYSLFGQRFGRLGLTATAQVLATILSFFTLTVALRFLQP
ncbi:AEC family transporter [Sinirhodobacter sp. WL0062]|uniref:AEC family transporter n=1 Tax=Rhodobacter flavimaris TaxID=2907145 RepID=A0ABS8YX04_9RHOB|nr:AEC family transporter [Sinirhodobacter sp. WL0062]MCE5973082.1 AEC family transporter [Sinirhodobacter sp. WL0062]